MSQERIDDSADSPWWGEHENRYDEALKYIGNGITILDIACGTGFGTYKLYKDGLNHVTGGDISEEALVYCREKYKSSIRENHFNFLKLDATALDFKDKTFDLIVSFETIEHIADYKKVVSEFKRVLKDDGTLLLSTPNRMVSSPTGKIVNPYHIQEFTYEELRSLLNSAFSDCKLGGQEYIRYKDNKHVTAFLMERFFYVRVIRRLSLRFRDSVMRRFGLPQFYPVSADYRMSYEMKDLLKCMTLFAICKK